MNFLRDRKYFVNVNGYNSNTMTSNIGVPQGFTLGPLLFLIYINDIINSSNILKFILFAEDITVIFECSDIKTLNLILKTETKKVVDWFSANKLLINLTKTNTMLFSNKLNLPKLKINIQNCDLEEKQALTFLGVVIDNKLLWKDHIDYISCKICKTVGILRILKRSFPIHVLRMIYMSLIYSYLNYCNIIWCSAYPCHLKSLFILQKKAVRTITNSRPWAESVPIFNSLKLLTLQNIYILNCLTFITNAFLVIIILL